MESQIAYVLFIVGLFLAFGALVRRGVVTGGGIIALGVVTGIAAVAATYFNIPLRLRQELPMMTTVITPGFMAICAAICTIIAYRAQQVVDLSTHHLGDTTIVARYSPAGRLEGDAILLPSITTYRMLGGFQSAVAVAAGRAVEREAMKNPAGNPGKVISTDGGNLAVERIFHIAVHEPMRAAHDGDLRRGLENAAQQARKAGAVSVSVPVGAMPGLSAAQVARAAAEVMVKHRRYFSRIDIAALELRNAATVRGEVDRAVAAATPTAGRADSRGTS